MKLLRSSNLATLLTLTCLFSHAGCTTTTPDTNSNGDQPLSADIPLNLGNGAGDIQLDAGVRTRLRGSGAINTEGLVATAGTIRIDTASVTFTPEENQVPADDTEQTEEKSGPRQQTAATIEITISLGDRDLVDTVCDEGQMFGPFTITLNENLLPVSVSPSSVALSQETVDLLNGGALSLCLDITSSVNGTIRVNNFIFSLEF